MILGAQLYTLRNEMKTVEGIEQGMHRVAAMGYHTVQVSGIGAIEPERLRAICDKEGLSIVITHTPQDRLLHDIDKVIAEHKILGCNLIGIGSMPSQYLYSLDGCEQFIKDYNPIARKVAANGMRFMYHNHNQEFEKFDGRTIFDRLVEGLDPSVGFTVDTYWVQDAGCDPATLIERLPGRVPAVHFKDMAYVDRKVVMAPVGEGNLDWKRITAACEKSGTKWALVEQDTCREDPFICLEKSLHNLQKLGYR